MPSKFYGVIPAIVASYFLTVFVYWALVEAVDVGPGANDGVDEIYNIDLSGLISALNQYHNYQSCRLSNKCDQQPSSCTQEPKPLACTDCKTCDTMKSQPVQNGAITEDMVRTLIPHLQYYGFVEYHWQGGKVVANAPFSFNPLRPWVASAVWMPDIVLGNCVRRLVKKLAQGREESGSIDCSADVELQKSLFEKPSDSDSLKKITAALRPLNEAVKSNGSYVFRRTIGGGIQFITAIVFIGGLIYWYAYQYRALRRLKYGLKRGGISFLDEWREMVADGVTDGWNTLRPGDERAAKYKQYLEESIKKGKPGSITVELAGILRDGIHQFIVANDASAPTRVVEAKLAHILNEFHTRRVVGKTVLQLMPMIGFIGTVYGLGISMGIADVIFKQDLPGDQKMSAVQSLMIGLSTAFDTTMVSLFLSALFLLVFTYHMMVENRLLNDLDRRFYDGFLNRLEN